MLKLQGALTHTNARHGTTRQPSVRARAHMVTQVQLVEMLGLVVLAPALPSYDPQSQDLQS